MPGVIRYLSTIPDIGISKGVSGLKRGKRLAVSKSHVGFGRLPADSSLHFIPGGSFGRILWDFAIKLRRGSP